MQVPLGHSTVSRIYFLNRHEIGPASPDPVVPVSAIIVAAGFSRRMGAFKLTLPWQKTTVVGQVAETLCKVNFREIVAVTGHRREEVEAALIDTRVRCVHNPRYATGEMLSSIQAGLAEIAPGVDAVLVCLGDQPQMEAATVQAVLAEGVRTGWRKTVIPSYDMRAGHPILVPLSLRLQIMNTTENLRSVLRANADTLIYFNVDTPTILADLDTPEDYARAHEASSSSSGTEVDPNAADRS
jgi:molybdenum cofactor cytidylyltransferase